MQAKIQLMESTIMDRAGRIDAYVTQMSGMMGTIENNDINMKRTFDTKMGELLATTNQPISGAAGLSNAQLQALRQEVGSNIAYIGLEQIQEQHKTHITAMEQEVLRIATETRTSGSLGNRP